MPRQVEGRRVENVEAIKQGGDYSVKYAEDGRIEAVWFAMPGFGSPRWKRINGPASSEKTRWEVTEDDDGKITVSPSILSEWKWGEDREQRRFHAFLKAGVWEVLDDTVGASF